METLLPQETTTKLQIPISHFKGHTDIDSVILRSLQNNLEGKCDNYGYIMKDTISLLNKSAGKILTIDRSSKIEYDVTYGFKSILPSPGDSYTCKIDSISKMGIIAYVKESDSLKESPLIIIVPQPFLDEDSSGSYEVGDTIQVVVVDSRIKYKNTQIQVVRKIG